MESSQHYISYKKVLIFGAQGTGKTTLVKRFDKGEFSEKITMTKEG